MTEGNFDNAVRHLRPHRLVCPNPECHEHRLDKLLPAGEGLVRCLTCELIFDVKE